MTMEIFAVTWDAQPALDRFVVRIILGIVTGVPEEGAAVIASRRTIVAQRSQWRELGKHVDAHLNLKLRWQV